MEPVVGTTCGRCHNRFVIPGRPPYVTTRVVSRMKKKSRSHQVWSLVGSEAFLLYCHKLGKGMSNPFCVLVAKMFLGQKMCFLILWLLLSFAAANETIDILSLITAIQSNNRSEVIVPTKALILSRSPELAQEDMALHYLVKRPRLQLIGPESNQSLVCSKSNPHQIVLDLSRSGSNLLQDGQQLSKDCVWIFIDILENREMLQQHMDIQLDSLVFLIKYHITPTKIHLSFTEYYTVNETFQIHRKVEDWEKDSGSLELVWKAPFLWKRRSNLNGTHFMVGFTLSGKSFFRDNSGQPSGFCYHLMTLLSKQLNFTFSPRVIAGYGAKLENGSWVGMVGEVANGNIDIIGSYLKLTIPRKEVVSYGMPFREFKVRLAYFGHKHQGTSLLDMLTWRFFGAVLASISLAAMLAVLIGRILNHGNYDDTSLVISIWGAFVAQGSSELLGNSSLRVVFLTCLIMGYVLLSSFSALLTSYLSVEIVFNEINEPEDLLAEDLNVFVHDGGSAMDFFRLAVEGTPQKKIWKEKMRSQSHYLAPTEEEMSERYAYQQLCLLVSSC